MEQIPKLSHKSNKDRLGERIEDILKDVPDFSQDKKHDTPKASPEEIEEAKKKLKKLLINIIKKFVTEKKKLRQLTEKNLLRIFLKVIKMLKNLTVFQVK